MDIGSVYGVDNSKTIELNVAGDAVIIVRHFDINNVEVLKIRNRLIKPYRKLIEVGALSPEKDRELAVQVFVEAAMMGWRNITVDGEELAFSRDAAIALFLKYPRLYADVVADAADPGQFRLSEETIKN